MNLSDNRILTAERRTALGWLALLLPYKKLSHERSGRRPNIGSSFRGGQYLNDILEGNPALSESYGWIKPLLQPYVCSSGVKGG